MSTVVILSAVIATLTVLLIAACFFWLVARSSAKESAKEAEEYLEMAKSNNRLLNEFKDVSEDTINALKGELDTAMKLVEELEKTAELRENAVQKLFLSIKKCGDELAESNRQRWLEKEESHEVLADLTRLQEKHQVLYHNFSFLLNVLAEHRSKNTFFAKNNLLAATLDTLVYDYTQSTIQVGIPDEIIEKAYFQHNGVGGVAIKPRIDAPRAK